MRRLAQFVRLRAFVSRASRVCLRLSRVCVHLSRVRLASVCVCLASACICLACVSRLSVCVCLACVCLRLFTSRVPNACVCSRLSASVVLSRICLASVVLSRVCLASCLASHVCLTSVSRLSRVCLSVLVNACGNWLILCVGCHSKSSKGFLLSSYYLIMSQCQSIHPIT